MEKSDKARWSGIVSPDNADRDALLLFGCDLHYEKPDHSHPFQDKCVVQGDAFQGASPLFWGTGMLVTRPRQTTIEKAFADCIMDLREIIVLEGIDYWLNPFWVGVQPLDRAGRPDERRLLRAGRGWREGCTSPYAHMGPIPRLCKRKLFSPYSSPPMIELS
jgi:hypothetical protein